MSVARREICGLKRRNSTVKLATCNVVDYAFQTRFKRDLALVVNDFGYDIHKNSSSTYVSHLISCCAKILCNTLATVSVHAYSDFCSASYTNYQIFVTVLLKFWFFFCAKIQISKSNHSKFQLGLSVAESAVALSVTRWRPLSGFHVRYWLRFLSVFRFE